MGCGAVRVEGGERGEGECEGVEGDGAGVLALGVQCIGFLFQVLSGGLCRCVSVHVHCRHHHLMGCLQIVDFCGLFG